MLETFGNFVEYEYKLSITELSRCSGISRQYLYKIKNGLVEPDSMSYGYYHRLSVVFGIDIDTLWILIYNSWKENMK